MRKKATWALDPAKHSDGKNLPALAGNQIPLALPRLGQFAKCATAAHKKLIASCLSSDFTDP
jgi:hypothetical protein